MLGSVLIICHHLVDHHVPVLWPVGGNGGEEIPEHRRQHVRHFVQFHHLEDLGPQPLLVDVLADHHQPAHEVGATQGDK
jgi:hypothetical protein